MRPARDLLLLLSLVLAACGREAADTPAAPKPAEPPAAGPAPTTAVTRDVPQPASYVGRWAASPPLCADGAWVFEPGRVQTAGEVACDFVTVTEGLTGYAVAAKCLAEGVAEPQSFHLAMSDEAPPQGMTVAGGPWGGPVSLRRCPG
ncbi:hypothetical protein [Phenylobacterium sp.]|uniref:hypothetical protein n=1 Tax=Phenylobacterium sp. TaxID=1871053 RepID=UPI0035B4E0BC